MVLAGCKPSTCGMYFDSRYWANIYKRADAAIYNAAVFNYRFNINARNNSSYNSRNEDMAVYAVIKNKISKINIEIEDKSC